jgi:hypothetical protein
LINGEVEHFGHEKAEALNSARMAVDQKISDHHRHDLPVQVDSVVARELDVYVYEMRDDNRLKLPFQQWFDDYYAEEQEYERKQDEHEWKQYLALCEKFAERIKDTARCGAKGPTG